MGYAKRASCNVSASFKTGQVEGVKVRELIERLEDDGWYQTRMRGSHRQFKHDAKPGTVTVAGKPNVDIPLGTLSSILKQAGLKR